MTLPPGSVYPVEALDKVFGMLHAMCSLVGLVGNVVLIWYFHTRIRRDLPTILYMLCCANDIVTSVLVLFVAICFFNKRDPVLFSEDLVCTAWALLLRINQKVTVFVVMVLTISRTVRLTSPLRVFRRRYALVSIGIWVFLVILYEITLTSKFTCLFLLYHNIL